MAHTGRMAARSARWGEVVINLSDSDYERYVRDSGYPVLLAFGSADDAGSRALAPVLTEVDNTFGDRLVVAVVDTPRCPRIVEMWGVERLPTMVLLRYGQPERVLRGVRPAARLAKELAEYL